MITMILPSFIMPIWLITVMEKLASTSHLNSEVNL